MKFSVIMPSYLGDYRNAAKDRDKKIVRAINSVFNQSFEDFELIVVADGCERTIDIVSQIDDLRLRYSMITKARTWGGTPRNEGIDQARGEYIIYLDVDDIYGRDHLKNVSEGLADFDWVWFDDIRYCEKTDEWYVNPCDIKQAGRHGTSNICHRRSLPNRWEHNGYAHDYYFIRDLLQNKNYSKIAGGEYYVCHIPNSSIGKGYDK